MSPIQNYFRREFRVENFCLNHENTSDFYLICWQKNRSTFPFLCIRVLLFFGCLGSAIAPVIIASRLESYSGSLWLYFIFVTNWGLTFNVAVNGFGVALSLKAYLKGPFVSTFSLPWFIKMYWILANIAVSWSFSVTIMYYGFFHESYAEMDNVANDVFSHAINSVFMLLLLLVSRHPMRILHFYQPLLVLFTYFMMTFIFYSSGGVNPYTGGKAIYRNFDWSNPQAATVTAIIFGVILFAAHSLVISISVGRDIIAKKYQQDAVYVIQ